MKSEITGMKFRLGVNYWPVSSAMYWWRRFNPDEVEGDFTRIRNAGFDSVRVFLLWEDFQPTPDRVSEEALQNLLAVADTAARHQLSLVPTLFTGHMSGVNWIPAWALESGGEAQRFRIVSNGSVVCAKLKNWYADQTVLSAQALLAREVAAALARHPALWAYDLGNENSNCVVPPTRESAIAWLETIAGAIRSADSSHPITIGLHMEDLEEDRRLTPKEAARVCDFLCMHGYPLYADWARSPTDEMLLPFLGLLTRWMSGKEVLFEEFGAYTCPRDDGKVAKAAVQGNVQLLTEEQAARFTQQALTALQHSGSMGAMLWCYGDYAESLWTEPPLDEAAHERSFGLWRSDHSPKPALAKIEPLAGSDRHEWNEDFSWIDIAADDFYRDPRTNLRRLYQRFRIRWGDVSE